MTHASGEEPGSGGRQSHRAQSIFETPMARRDVLQHVAKLGVAVGATAVAGPLAGCGSSSTHTVTTTHPVRPKRGGTLRAALLTGSSADTLDGDSLVTWMDIARANQLYNPLTSYTSDMGLQLGLAEEFRPTTPNGDQWLIRLRPDVEFHNGKTLSSADVRYTLQRVVANKFDGYPLIAPINVSDIKLLDARSLLVPFHTPFSIFNQSMASSLIYIVPEGFDPRHPVGTGPFKFESFTPGVTSTFVRNQNYWQTGLPYLDEVVIDDYADTTSQANALLSGQADVIGGMAFGAVPSVKSAGKQTVVNKGAGFYPIIMRVDSPPFNDVRVRQAMRLIIDRPQTVAAALSGYGEIANDLFSPLDPDFDHAFPQRQQDIPEAKRLLRAAGHTSLSVSLVTAPLAAGFVETAEVFAQNAAQAGVNVSVDQVTSGVIFGPNYLNWPFSMDDWSAYNYLLQVLMAMLPTSPFNESHWNDPKYTSLAQEALATTDNPGKLQDIVHEMQTIEWNEGGYIVPYYPWIVDGLQPKVHGVLPTRTGFPLNSFAFDSIWLS
jgi:peptide/nickel transport system substrate-binding protein